MVMQRTRIKICGITRLKDAIDAVRFGADALGFVFYPPSPRAITPEQAANIIAKLPPFVSCVGLFVNPSQADIDQTLSVCPLDQIQLHGSESAEFCARQLRRVIKAIPVQTAEDLDAAKAYNCAILLDAKAPKGVHGGTGQCFDWRVLQGFEHAHPLILAGGLHPENVTDALAIRPWFALDVSSGVESAAGVKDPARMNLFFQVIQRAQTHSTPLHTGALS